MELLDNLKTPYKDDTPTKKAIREYLETTSPTLEMWIGIRESLLLDPRGYPAKLATLVKKVQGDTEGSQDMYRITETEPPDTFTVVRALKTLLPPKSLQSSKQ